MIFFIFVVVLFCGGVFWYTYEMENRLNEERGRIKKHLVGGYWKCVNPKDEEILREIDSKGKMLVWLQIGAGLVILITFCVFSNAD